MASSLFFKATHPSFSSALFIETRIFPSVLKRIKPALFLGCIFLVSLFFIGFFGETFEKGTLQLILGGSFITFSLLSSTILAQYFLEYLIQRPFQEPDNVASQLSYDAYKAVVSSKSSATLFLALLKLNPSLSFVLLRALLDPKNLQDEVLKGGLDQDDFLETLKSAVQHARQRGRERATKADLFIACFVHNPVLSDVLSKMSLTVKDISYIALWQEAIQEELDLSRKFWTLRNLRKMGTLARSWSAGYTVSLDKFGVDIGEFSRKSGFPRAIGHEKERQAIDRVLSRTQLNNVLLIGDPGSGRKSIVLDFASRVVLGEVPAELAYKRVVELNLTALAASLQSKEVFELVLDGICREIMNAGDTILFIDEFHNFVGTEASGRAGTIDVTGILSPYLASSRFQVIASTTFGGLHQYIEQNRSLLSLFEKVEVAEISEEDSIRVLSMITPELERRSKKFISYPALRDAVTLSAKYVQGDPLPEKAMRLLDEAIAHLSQTKEKILLPGHVAYVLREKTQIPIGDLEDGEKEKLLHLEELLGKRVIGQKEALSEVSSALRRSRTEIASRKGPMGTFLFIGSTGVGKTETAKALAAIYFGSESRMIRLDMSEFQNLKDIDRLLGSIEHDGLLTTPVRENPFSLLLLDEFEKGHPNILNLFLQVLDEGHVTDGAGRKVNFKNTIIICTSNAGYQLILSAIKEKKDFMKLKEEMLSSFFREGTFRPELVNRFDAVVLFKPLEQEHLNAIAGIMLSKVKKNMEAKGIEFIVSDALKMQIAQLGYDPTFGARNMQRVIQDTVENSLATAFLKDAIKRGDSIEVDPASFAVRLLTK